MKGVKKLIWVALVVGMVLALASCDNFAPGSGSSGGGSNPVAEAKLVGTWTGSWTMEGGGEPQTITMDLKLNSEFQLNTDNPTSEPITGNWSATTTTLNLTYFVEDTKYDMKIFYKLSNNGSTFIGKDEDGSDYNLKKQS